MNRHRPIILALLMPGGLGACSPMPSPLSPPVASPPSATMPNDRTPLGEPHGPIDPHSAEGARQVVQRYAALLGERRFAEAARLWSPGLQPDIAATLASSRSVAGLVGRPFDEEGAAGSIFVNVPLQLIGTDAGGRQFDLVGDLTLRRVNGVSGATRAQLDWHIVASSLARKR